LVQSVGRCKPTEEFRVAHKDIREVLGLAEQLQRQLLQRSMLITIVEKRRREARGEKSMEVIEGTPWIGGFQEVGAQEAKILLWRKAGFDGHLLDGLKNG
jgi:hypothetical protein